MNTIKQVSNSSQVSRLVLRGYKSIVEYDPKLDRLTILNGANGEIQLHLLLSPDQLHSESAVADCHWSRGGPDAIQRECPNFVECLPKVEALRESINE